MISIQVLRGIAALLVVMVHATLKTQSMSLSDNIFAIGHSGVDLFFMISGYIMMLVSDKEDSFKVFAYKRIVRVVPLYYIITTAALVIFLINPSLIKGNQGGISILHSYLLIPEQGKSFLLSVGWTLSYEMFFYAVFAVCMAINKKFRGLICIAALCVISIIGSRLSPGMAHDFFSPILIEFGMGIAIFLFTKDSETIYERKSLLQLSSLLILLLVLYVYDNRFLIHTVFTNRVEQLAPIAVMIFLSFVLSEFAFKKYAESPLVKLFNVIGDCSYSLYLTHLFVIGVISKVFLKLGFNSSIAFVSLTLITSVIVSVAVSKAIEKPLSRFFRRVSPAKNKQERVA